MIARPQAIGVGAQQAATRGQPNLASIATGNADPMATSGGATGGINAPTSNTTDSDSDWDDDDDFASRKINIKIKPIAQVTPGKISSSVDELRATVETWKSMSNVNLVKPNSRRNCHSVYQLNNNLNNPNNNTNTANGPVQCPPQLAAPSMLDQQSPVSGDGIATQFFTETTMSDGRPPMRNGRRPVRFSISSNCSSSTRNIDEDPFVQFSPSSPQLLDRGAHLMNKFCTNSMNIPRNQPPVQDGAILRPTASSLADLLDSTCIDTSMACLSSFGGQVSAQLPVAFAVQECLNAHMSATANVNSHRVSLSGAIKMAISPSCLDSLYGQSNELELDFCTAAPWTRYKLNEQFVKTTSLDDQDDNNEPQMLTDLASVGRRFIIDMSAIRLYAHRQSQIRPNAKYFVSPKLLEYNIGSQCHERPQLYTDYTYTDTLQMLPLQLSAHWLCDQGATKVRVDLHFLSDTLGNPDITLEDIVNVQIKMHINGGPIGHKTKPDASWNSANSTLTWSFASLTDVIQPNERSGSCLARFELNSGPSSTNDVELKFAIVGKTLSGASLKIKDDKNFRLTKQKSEVRTGTFRCEPTCI